ncbi:MAG: glycosyltransferase family 2 protein [Alphaproteobacteria bacterium]
MDWSLFMVKVSVIIPVYRVEKYLRDCVRSVIEQSFKDIEIILVDDGSPDECPQICDEYAKQDARIKVIHQQNKGLSGARNTGIEKASGEYLFFVDSDDQLHPQAIEILLNIAQKTAAPITLSTSFLRASKKQAFHLIQEPDSIAFKRHTNPVKDMLKSKHISSAWNKLFKRELFQNWRFIEGIQFEDWPLNTCLFSEIPFYVSVDVPLYFYNDTNASTVRSPFTVKKIQDYTTGIHFVYAYYQTPKKKKLWRLVQKYRIYQSMKMVINKVYHTQVDKKELREVFCQNFKELKQRKIILIRDFSLKSLYRTVHLLKGKIW